MVSRLALENFIPAGGSGYWRNIKRSNSRENINMGTMNGVKHGTTSLQYCVTEMK